MRNRQWSGLISLASATTAITAAAAGTLFAWARFIYGQGAAFPIFAVQGEDGRFGAFFGVHRRKGKATGPSGDAIGDDIDLVDGAVRGKHVAQVVFGDVEG